MFGVALIGCGLIGARRATTLAPGGRLVACADTDLGRARRLAEPHGAWAGEDWRHVLDRADVDIVIVATRHDSLGEISRHAIMAGKHVLVEKPAARSAGELQPVLLAERNSKVRVRVGFNHRHHRALRQAREIVDRGDLGELMFIRARYGHGGRPGYDNEWRSDPVLSGGGELIDQGSHLIDLARHFLGEFTHVSGFVKTYFWNMPVDDNAFLLLRTATDRAAFLHASCTEWKNLFSMEIYGRDGKLDINGLGGSYGVERLAWYRMLPQMGPPETTIWEYPMQDDSWSVEMQAFYADIRAGRQPDASLADAFACLSIIESIYRENGLDHRP